MIATMMMVSCFGVTGYAADFYDIDSVPWDGAKTYISSVADKGLMVGDIDPDNGKKRFRAKAKVTYCETTQLAYTVLKNAGKLNTSGTNLSSKWTHVMKSYNIPNWAYESVAYALENNVISLTDVSRFMTKKGNTVKDNYASRESVAVIFGKMLGNLYTLNNNASLSYLDKSSIASTSVPYVDLLSRLGILVGDTDNNFTPKAYINRAEMAVIAAKAYDVLGGSGGTTNTAPVQEAAQEITGTVSSIEQYGDSKLLAVTASNGQRQGFMINSTTYVLQGNSTTQLNIGNITVGASVTITYEGAQVKVIRLMSDVQNTTQVKGTVDEITNTRVYVLKSDSKIDSFYFADNCTYTLEGKSTTMKSIFDAYEDNKLGVTLTLDSASYVSKAEFTKTAETSYTGTLVSIDDDELGYKKSSSSKTEYYSWISDPTILLENKSSTISKIKTANKSDTLYVKFYLDSNDKIKKVLVSTDKFSSTNDGDITGTVTSLSDEKVKLKRTDNKETESYTFNSSIKYYLDGEESTYKKVNAAYDTASDKSKNFYVKVVLNSSDKVTKLYASTDKSNLDGDSYDTTIDGILISIDADSLRVEESNGKRYSYDMADDVTYLLEDKSSTLKAIESARKDAASDSDDLYVTIYLNSSKKVVKVKASEDESNSSNNGTIKSMTKSKITIKGESSRDISSKVKITLDGDSMDLSDMVDAVGDSDRTFEAELTTSGGEVTKIVAETVYASGELLNLVTGDREIKIKTDEGKFTYTIKSSSIDCSGKYDNVQDLVGAVNDGEDLIVQLTIKDGKVTEIYSKKG